MSCAGKVEDCTSKGQNAGGTMVHTSKTGNNNVNKHFVGGAGEKGKTVIIKTCTGEVLFQSGATTVWQAILDAIYAKAKLIGADLRYAYLRDSNLRGINLSSADLSGADLRSAILSIANLSGARLYMSGLRYAVLYRTNLSRADLSWADLRDTYLVEADLSNANLRGALLYRAYLYYANLSGADLRGAFLRGANLTGANLSGAIGVYEFGPIGEEGITGYAIDSADGVMFLFGNFLGSEKEVIEFIRAEYGSNSPYEEQIKLAAKNAKELFELNSI